MNETNFMKNFRKSVETLIEKKGEAGKDVIAYIDIKKQFLTIAPEIGGNYLLQKSAEELDGFNFVKELCVYMMKKSAWNESHTKAVNLARMLGINQNSVRTWKARNNAKNEDEIILAFMLLKTMLNTFLPDFKNREKLLSEILILDEKEFF